MLKYLTTWVAEEDPPGESQCTGTDWCFADVSKKARSQEIPCFQNITDQGASFST